MEYQLDSWILDSIRYFDGISTGEYGIPMDINWISIGYQLDINWISMGINRNRISCTGNFLGTLVSRSQLFGSHMEATQRGQLQVESIVHRQFYPTHL